MNRVKLSETEKRILKDLSISEYKGDMFSDLPKAELSVASNRLKEYGLINAHYVEGNELVAARILDEGIVYLKENPMLENPADENMLKKLQIDELEYKKRIRKQEDVIRFWKLLSALAGISGFIGWILFFFF